MASPDDKREIDVDASLTYDLRLDSITTAQIVTQLTQRYRALEHTTHFRLAAERDVTRHNLALIIRQLEGYNQRPTRNSLLDLAITEAINHCLMRPDPEAVTLPPNSPLAVARMSTTYRNALSQLDRFTRLDLAEALIRYGGTSHAYDTPEEAIIALARHPKRILLKNCWLAGR